MAFEKVAQIESIPNGQGMVVEAGGKQIAIFHCDGSFYGTQGACPHRGGPLAEGLLEGSVVTCPWHGWEFDIASGECRTNPRSRITTFPLRIEGNDILVDAGE